MFLPAPSWVCVGALSTGKDRRLWGLRLQPLHPAKPRYWLLLVQKTPGPRWHVWMVSSYHSSQQPRRHALYKATCPRSPNTEVPGRSLSLDREDIPILRRKGEGFGPLRSAFHHCPCRRVTLQPYGATACPRASRGRRLAPGSPSFPGSQADECAPIQSDPSSSLPLPPGSCCLLLSTWNPCPPQSPLGFPGPPGAVQLWPVCTVLVHKQVLQEGLGGDQVAAGLEGTEMPRPSWSPRMMQASISFP